MGKYFSDIVEKAVSDIYYCYDNARATQAADDLALAATEQEDGDACYILARCFSRACQAWKYHPFEENQGAVYTMLRKGIFLGSAPAVVGALRMGALNGELLEIMPFSSIREPWEMVLEKAEDGCPFCQYLVGSTFYYLDIRKLRETEEHYFVSQGDWEEWQRQQILEGVSWYEKAFENGMGLAGRNLIHYYDNGRAGLIPPEREMVRQVVKKGAELGYPDGMFDLACDLCRGDEKEEGLSWARRAAEMGHLEGWRLLGDACRDGQGEEALVRALECYEKAAAAGDDPDSSGQAGEMYFLGLGADRDYKKAVEYLEQNFALRGNEGRPDILGLCLLLGYGCERDPERGRQLLEESRDTRYRSYGLGMMYADGIGVDQDIKTGVGYLKAAGDYEPAREALKQFKRGFWGGWKRR